MTFSLQFKWLYACLAGMCWRKSGLRGRQSAAVSLPIKRLVGFVFDSLVVPWGVSKRKSEFQMALIARLQHPYIVEFKEAWVEKVCKFRN
jgi:hypothetical protein